MRRFQLLRLPARTMSNTLRSTVLLSLMVALTVVAGAAHASFPGEPGRIAFYSNRDGDFDVYTMNPSGNDIISLTTDPGRDEFPSWSADGSRIAFTSTRDGNTEVFI
jgi:hypothetical protein